MSLLHVLKLSDVAADCEADISISKGTWTHGGRFDLTIDRIDTKSVSDQYYSDGINSFFQYCKYCFCLQWFEFRKKKQKKLNTHKKKIEKRCCIYSVSH